MTIKRQFSLLASICVGETSNTLVKLQITMIFIFVIGEDVRINENRNRISQEFFFKICSLVLSFLSGRIFFAERVIQHSMLFNQ